MADKPKTEPKRGRGRPPKLPKPLQTLATAAGSVQKLAAALSVDRGTITRWGIYLTTKGAKGQEPLDHHRAEMTQFAQENGMARWADPFTKKASAK